MLYVLDFCPPACHRVVSSAHKPAVWHYIDADLRTKRVQGFVHATNCSNLPVFLALQLEIRAILVQGEEAILKIELVAFL